MAVKIPSKLGSMSPTFQKAWYKRNKMPLPAHLTGSVKQASKEIKPSERVKKLQAKSVQAYGATKGTKVGGEHGSAEMRDTIKPLTRDQHSKVQAAERAAKAAAKAANPKPIKPAKPKTPLSKDERIAAIRRAVAKNKAKDRFDVPTVNPDDMDHDDLRDVHTQMHVRKTYSEAVGPYASGPVKVYTPAEIEAMNRERGTIPGKKTEEPPKKKKPPADVDALLHAASQKGTKLRKKRSLKRIIDGHKYHSFIGNVSGYKEKSSKKSGMNRFEEVELDEVTKQEAEKMLGGPVKTRTGTEPKGKLPLGFRRARNLARKAMKGGVDAIHRSMEKTMQKENVKESTTEVSEVNEMNHGKKLAKMIMAKQSQHPIAQNMGEENIVEQDDTMEKKEMAQTQLHFIGYAAKEILEFIDMGGEIEEWYQNKLSKVQSEVESLHSYIEGEKRRTGMVEETEQIDEKAPPGAKYERMVKHIKKGYAKDGLTPQEKSIAYATAWKAYGKKEEVETEETAEQIDEKYMGFKAVMAAAKKGGARDPAAVAASIGRKKYGKEKFQAMAAAGKKKANEEVDTGEAEARKTAPSSKEKQEKVFAKHKERMKELAKEEVVTEAEGTVAVTPKEKALAAHHGDPKKITYGDVIKARLKSAAAKKMGK
jgi:hypothetical protein